MVLDNRLYVEENKCEKCENINICKWCDEMKSTREYVKNIPNLKGFMPIKIKVTCDGFKIKKEVPHGWTSGIR